MATKAPGETQLATIRAFPAIDVYRTDHMQKLCDGGRAAAMDVRDYLGTLATPLERRLIRQLEREGMTSRSMLGNDAARHVRRIIRHVHYAHDLAETMGQTMTRLWAAYNFDFRDQIFALREERRHDRDEFEV